jgi:hypothetical protein
VTTQLQRRFWNPALRQHIEGLEAEVVRLREERDRLADLLRRVEPELIPNHDDAEALATKFGLGPLGRGDFIREIREALVSLPGREDAKQPERGRQDSVKLFLGDDLREP